MRILELLGHGRGLLAGRGTADGALEAEVLLRHALSLDRARLYASLQDEAEAPEVDLFNGLLERRLDREPLPYITAHREFYGLEFAVDSRVLIPRPDTEVLVEKALEMLEARPAGESPVLVDVGTGCGAIAVALARHLPSARIYATDISEDALEVAWSNCLAHSVEERVRLLEGDLLEPLPEAVDLIVANLPYVRKGDFQDVQRELLFEPRLALDGGPDGLDPIRRLLEQAPGALREDGAVILEIDPRQADAVTKLARRAFPGAQVSIARDLAGLDRAVIARRVS